MANGGAAHNFAPCSHKFAHGGSVERVNGGDHAAIKRAIQLAPFAGGNHGASGKAHGGQHCANHHRIGGEHLAQKGHLRAIRAACGGGRHGASHNFRAGIFQHRACQNILGLGMGGNAKAWHVNTHNAHPVDFIGKQFKRHAACRWHAKIGDNNRIIAFGVGKFMHRIADIFEQLARDQTFGIEWHIAHRPARAVEMRHKGQPIDAAGTARKNCRHPPHPQPHAQAAKGRAHGLGFIMRALGIIGGVLIQKLRIACRARGLLHGGRACMAAHAIGWGLGQRR